MSWTIERPSVDDADEMALVHVTVWREAYAGLMPADHLAGLDPTAFAASWRRRLADPVPGVHTWVSRDEQGICGLVTAGSARDEDAPTPEELYAINVLRRAHGTGLARALLRQAIGDRAAYLWVLDGNLRAEAFYRRHGFTDEGGRKAEPGTGVTEIRMCRDAVAP